MSILFRIKSLVASKDRSQDLDLVDTAPLRPETVQARKVQPATRFEAAHAQATGHLKEINEDSIGYILSSSSGAEVHGRLGAFALADGAGGHGHGQEASQIAVRTALQSLLSNAFRSYYVAETDTAVMNPEDIVRQAIEQANDAILNNSNGGVTTLTLALLHTSGLTIGHVGDCRAYSFQEGSGALLTRDHSYPWRLVEIGQLSPEEARTHSKRNMLWNALGQSGDLLIDVDTHPIPANGAVLLCSDGLWSALELTTIEEQFGEIEEPRKLCKELVSLADEVDGSDNISALLITFPPTG